MLDLLKVGLPAGFELMLNVSLWGVILCSLVGRFGKEALAATNAVIAFCHFTVMPVVGFKVALGAAVGKSIGQNRKKVAVKQTRICLKIAIVYMGLAGICFLVFRDFLILAWSDDPKVIQLGADILIFAAVYQVFQAARTIYSGALQGAGDTLWLAVVSAIGALVVLGLGGYTIIILLPELGVFGPWTAGTLSIVAVGIANRWRFKSKEWMKIDLFKRYPAAIAPEAEVGPE